MDKESILFYSLIIMISIICFQMYYDSDTFQLKCIISSMDGNTYCVRDRRKLEMAADLLAEVTRRCKTLCSFVYEKYKNKEGIERLYIKFDKAKIIETLPTSEYTAYSENKGDKLAFCLDRSKKGASRLIDINTLTFVAIHELSHIMTTSTGHDQIFWENFKFLLEHAVEIGIYIPIDYKKKPAYYCDMKLTDNPYFDM